jgi:hypothetical protein
MKDEGRRRKENKLTKGNKILGKILDFIDFVNDIVELIMSISG